jgi:hypothetical protein
VKSHYNILSKDPRERPLILYTDRSGIEGRIGAAVADLQNRHINCQMGDEDMSTVFAAELRGVEMALNSTLDSAEQWQNRRRTASLSSQTASRH